MMMTITGVQIRAARALLAWSEAELSTASGISENTITGLELREGPLGEDLEAGSTIRRAFEGAGVEFTDSGEHGVQLGATWFLHRVADRSEIDSETRGEARVVRCPEGLRCVSADGELLGTARNGPNGIVTDPDIGPAPTADRVTPSDLRTWLRAALGRMSGVKMGCN